MVLISLPCPSVETHSSVKRLTATGQKRQKKNQQERNSFRLWCPEIDRGSINAVLSLSLYLSFSIEYGRAEGNKTTTNTFHRSQ